MSQPFTHAYLGVRPCGHVMYMGVDDGSRELARDIADLVKDGNTLSRVTIEEARATPIYCTCDQPADYVAKQKAAMQRDKRRRRRK